MFRFGSTELLFAYVLIPVLVVFLWLAIRWKRKALLQFGEHDLVQRLTRTASQRVQSTKLLLLVVAVAASVTALARPQFGTRVETVRREGQDVIVALDLSNSMLAEDIAPNRLQRAKLAVAQLIERLDGDRIGLIAFAGEAFVQSPLTSDYSAAMLFLNAMEPGIVPIQGTNLGAALEVALDAFDEASQQHRVLIVITDGEDHEGEIESVVERAGDMGIQIHAVGIGSQEGVPIPEFDDLGRRSGFKRDADGSVVTTRLDEETLQRIARLTGGSYFRATGSGRALNALADEIVTQEGREFEAQQVTQFEEQYQVFLGLAILLLFVEVMIPDRRSVKAEWRGRFL
ncbi:MAG: VWA domain-containing protein [Gemmatimonadota bacterium]|nr:MAG: VWA domain-containing protein [Gemmatimonadota bacterium]